MAERTSEGDQRITVVLADDHPVVRSGLRMLLEAEQDVLGHKPSVLVLDLNMPGEPPSRRSR